MGAMTSMMAPHLRRPGWVGAPLDWWAKARPPLWQYLVGKHVTTGERRAGVATGQLIELCASLSAVLY